VLAALLPSCCCDALALLLLLLACVVAFKGSWPAGCLTGSGLLRGGSGVSNTEQSDGTKLMLTPLTAALVCLM
jgi:hypothetical protein